MDNDMPITTITLTEAQAAGGVVEIRGVVNAAHVSNAREIPYAEIYRERTSLLETPIQRLQRAADDEARRLRDRQQHQ